MEKKYCRRWRRTWPKGLLCAPSRGCCREEKQCQSRDPAWGPSSWTARTGTIVPIALRGNWGPVSLGIYPQLQRPWWWKSRSQLDTPTESGLVRRKSFTLSGSRLPPGPSSVPREPFSSHSFTSGGKWEHVRTLLRSPAFLLPHPEHRGVMWGWGWGWGEQLHEQQPGLSQGISWLHRGGSK